jgi:hypothetical protein
MSQMTRFSSASAHSADTGGGSRLFSARVAVHALLERQ